MPQRISRLLDPKLQRNRVKWRGIDCHVLSGINSFADLYYFIFFGISPFFLSCFPSGKYPHIILSSAGKPPTTLNKDVLEAVIQFSPTSVGTTVQKMVELHNLSAVRIVWSFLYYCRGFHTKLFRNWIQVWFPVTSVFSSDPYSFVCKTPKFVSFSLLLLLKWACVNKTIYHYTIVTKHSNNKVYIVSRYLPYWKEHVYINEYKTTDKNMKEPE